MPDALGDGEGARAPGGAGSHAERRAADALVELHRRREDVGSAVRPLLHRGEVRRGDREAAAAEVLLEDRRRDGAPLVGVGAAPELVEEDEAPRRRGGERRRRARHRAREGGEVAEEVLRVARDDEEPVEDGERRPRVGRDGEARLREEREEADRLHRDGLAAGVRAREEDEPLPLVEDEVERHGVGRALLGPLPEDLLAQRARGAGRGAGARAFFRTSGPSVSGKTPAERRASSARAW